MRPAKWVNMVRFRVASAVGEFDGVTANLATELVVAFELFGEFRVAQNAVNG